MIKRILDVIGDDKTLKVDIIVVPIFWIIWGLVVIFNHTSGVPVFLFIIMWVIAVCEMLLRRITMIIDRLAKKETTEIMIKALNECANNEIKEMAEVVKDSKNKESDS